jgi:hypothetical protein
MTSDSNIIVTTLLAEKGKKYDTDKKCIGSYDRSIVFLPADVKPGEIVRVSLREVSEKKDSRGMVMYFARHAPAPISDDALRQIRDEAKVLDTMSNFDEETALTLLRARHGMVIDAWKGYRHYYLDESGAVYVSDFSPATLSLFQYLKRGAGLTEPLLWILGGQKPDESSLYRKRERGEEIDWQFSVPPLGDAEVASLEEKVTDGQLLLSDTLIEMRSGELHSEGWLDQLFPQASWPTLSVPDFEGGEDVPDIVEHEYGKGLNGQSLLGYAVFGPSDPAWYRNRAEAEEAHQAAVTKLAELRQTWRQRDELKPLIEELNVRRERLGLTPLTCERDTFKVDWSSYEYTKDNLARFERETIDKEEAEVKTAMKAAMREARERAEAQAAKKAEAEALRAEQKAAEHEAELKRREAAGGIIRNLRVWVHTSSKSGDAGAFVVAASGELREHDRDEYERSHGRGAHHVIWDLVEETEGVVEWSAGSSSAPKIPTLPVRKKPEGGWTPAQLETLRRIEEEFGVDPADSWVQAIKHQHPVPGRLGASQSQLDELADWFNKSKR